MTELGILSVLGRRRGAAIENTSALFFSHEHKRVKLGLVRLTAARCQCKCRTPGDTAHQSGAGDVHADGTTDGLVNSLSCRGQMSLREVHDYVQVSVFVNTWRGADMSGIAIMTSVTRIDIRPASSLFIYFDITTTGDVIHCSVVLTFKLLLC